MSLKVHVFGPGVGESIVVQFPDLSWGVVDCFADSASDQAACPVADWLASRGVGALRFVCWTHPHADHTAGLPALLRAFRGRVGEFWTFGAMPAFKLWLAVEEASAGPTYYPRNSHLYTLARDFGGPKGRTVSAGKPLWSDPVTGVEVLGLAPADRMVSAYVASAQRRLSPSTRARPRRAPDANRFSAALLIRYGSTQVILGGDVTSGGWKFARREIATSSAPSWPRLVQVVKASHHGSKGSYHRASWNDWAPPGRPCASILVTPFEDIEPPPLPRAEGLSLLRQHGPVSITGSRDRQAETQPLPTETWEFLGTLGDVEAMPALGGDPISVEITADGVLSHTTG